MNNHPCTPQEAIIILRGMLDSRRFIATVRTPEGWVTFDKLHKQVLKSFGMTAHVSAQQAADYADELQLMEVRLKYFFGG